MIPKKIVEWRQDDALLELGRRLLANDDFKQFMRAVEGMILLDAPLQDARIVTSAAVKPVSDSDIQRDYGRVVGQKQILTFIYTMGTRYVPKKNEDVPADFGTDKSQPGG